MIQEKAPASKFEQLIMVAEAMKYLYQIDSLAKPQDELVDLLRSRSTKSAI